MKYASDVKITSRWLRPHFPPREDRPLEMTMLKEWKKYMIYEDHHACGWTSRLVAHILAPIPEGLNVRTGRVATTCAVWLMMPVGLGFFETVLHRIQQEKSESYGENIAIAAWALENRLGLATANRLEHFLRNEKREAVYKKDSYPLLSDSRAVEQTLCFLVGGNGRDLLKKVLTKAGMPNRLRL